MALHIGIDLGGTKISGIALDGAGDVRARARTTTPADDYEATVEAVLRLVVALEADAGATAAGVGLSTPGALSPATGLLRNSNATWLNGRPFDRDLAAALGRPVRIANDANCFALSEAVDGAAAGAPIVFGVILGTGVGGGIVVERRALTGAAAIAGEWGHNPLPRMTDAERPGPPCYCGHCGCIETFLSGPGLARDHLAESGRRCTPAEIVAAADAGDRAAVTSMTRYQERLGRALALIVNILDPHVIVLGGGLSNADRLYDGLAERLGQYVFSDVVASRVVRARHGDDSGVRGAAWLWPG